MRGPNTYLTTACDLCRDRGEVAKRRETLQRLALELAHALPREPELVADRLERPRVALEAEAELEDARAPARGGR